jgi:holo-[acyl-carrier protein] synthase
MFAPPICRTRGRNNDFPFRQLGRRRRQPSEHRSERSEQSNRARCASSVVIVGVGIDVCDVDRFAESIERRPGLVQRIFTPAEAERPIASKAARFAAKEALAKALGAPDGLSWRDAEVVTDDHGKPSFKIMGTVAARAAELGIGTIHLSMSHDAGIASAVVICEA